MKSDLIDICVERHAETEKAILVSDDGDKDKAVWIPKSQIEIEVTRGQCVVTLPEWLAKQRGLI